MRQDRSRLKSLLDPSRADSNMSSGCKNLQELVPLNLVSSPMTPEDTHENSLTFYTQLTSFKQHLEVIRMSYRSSRISWSVNDADHCFIKVAAGELSSIDSKRTFVLRVLASVLDWDLSRGQDWIVLRCPIHVRSGGVSFLYANGKVEWLNLKNQDNHRWLLNFLRLIVADHVEDLSTKEAVECNWYNCSGVQSAWISRSKENSYVYIECHQESQPLLDPTLSNTKSHVSQPQEPVSNATMETVSMGNSPHTQELHVVTAANTVQSFSGMTASYDVTAILSPTQAASGYDSVYGDS
jgi:hypothetical protein